MPATAAITTIRATHGRKFVAHKMPAARTTMTTSCKYSYVINKICLFHLAVSVGKDKFYAAGEAFIDKGCS